MNKKSILKYIIACFCLRFEYNSILKGVFKVIFTIKTNSRRKEVVFDVIQNKDRMMRFCLYSKVSLLFLIKSAITILETNYIL